MAQGHAANRGHKYAAARKLFLEAFEASGSAAAPRTSGLRTWSLLRVLRREPNQQAPTDEPNARHVVAAPRLQRLTLVAWPRSPEPDRLSLVA